MTDIQRFSYDVVVIGAGGSGLRAAIAAVLGGGRSPGGERRDGAMHCQGGC